jgi:competence protein ComFC
VESCSSQSASRRLLDAFNHLLWPAVCVNCGTTIIDSSDTLCRNCWTELLNCTTDSYCRRCGRDAAAAAIVNERCPACVEEDFHFDAIARCARYDGTVKSMILAFKNSHCELAPMLAGIARTSLDSSSFCDNIDYLVPVPLHWARRLKRGYNQAALVAKKLCVNDIKLSNDLVRIRNTPIQPSFTSPAARTRNVADAFAVRNGHDFADKTICLVDDVKTTGATLNECAKTLKQAGAKKVYALVLAVAGQFSA